MPESLTFIIQNASDIGEFWNTDTITGTHTVSTANTVILADATSGSLVVTLPPAATVVDRVVNVKKIDATGNTVTVDGDGTETIDGATTQVISTQHTSITMVSDGSNWRIL